MSIKPRFLKLAKLSSITLILEICNAALEELSYLNFSPRDERSSLSQELLEALLIIRTF
jgi:hypothetical protein